MLGNASALKKPMVARLTSTQLAVVQRDDGSWQAAVVLVIVAMSQLLLLARNHVCVCGSVLRKGARRHRGVFDATKTHQERDKETDTGKQKDRQIGRCAFLISCHLYSLQCPYWYSFPYRSLWPGYNSTAPRMHPLHFMVLDPSQTASE